ncbi:MAG: glycosyltransferase family 4 protein [Bacillaceae bacterium]|nr:glycosyltransferase family 4 protein [Bacillaceae bacterium]
MKIAVISPGSFSVPPVIGSSVEHDIYMIAQEYQKAHQVTIYTRKCREYPHSTTSGNLTIKRFKFADYRDYLHRVICDLKRMKPDVVQVENRPHYVPAVKKHLPHIPVVLVMHSAVFASPPVISEIKMRRAMARADAMITNSHYLKTYFAKKYKKYAGKIHPVHLGIDLKPYEEAEKNDAQIKKLKGKYQLTDDDKILLFAGRIKKEKGVHLIIQSLPEILKHHPNTRLVIAGSPVYGRNIRTHYMKWINRKSRKLKSHIRYTRFVRPDRIPYIMRMADLVVTPSIWAEPFCRVNLEAMASKKPVITTNRGGIPEVVEDQKSGIVIPVQEWKREFPMVLKERTDEEWAEMGERARERARSFTWEKTAQGYIDVFQSLLRGAEIHETVGV